MSEIVNIYRRRIPEIRVPGMPLGRHVHFDSRSALYPFTSDFPRDAIGPAAWVRHIDPLDQGDLGSCTGNAMVGCAATSPAYEALPVDHPALNEPLAVRVYSSATQLDPYPGQYPPTDTGSDGIDAAKAAVQIGLFAGYTHCTDLPTMELALQTTSVAVGVNWYSSFDRPDPNGLVAIASSAYVRGGHEFQVIGVDPSAQMFYAVNSWGMGWGKNGTFCFSYATMERLLAEEGDCTAPTPVNQPAPTPTPTPPGPPPSPDDPLLAAVKVFDLTARPWSDKHRYSRENRALQHAIWDLEDAAGLS